MLKIIVFAPLIGAIINGLFGRRFLAILGQRATEKLVGFIACASVGVSAALAFTVFFGRQWPVVGGKPQITEHFFTWLKVGSFQADFAYLLDPLSGIYILFITGVGLLIHIYATGYMHGDPGYYRFFCYLNLFMFMMLTLVLADNLLLLFVGWEGVGLCSYLLIGYYIKWDVAGSAAKKAFVMNRIGDFGFMIATFMVFTTFGTISFVSKNINGQEIQSFLAQAASSPVAVGTLTAIALLFFVGATGKSAQIPLFTWLPDAMAGPTPVSALIHAATMVTAGVYLVARCSPVFLRAPTAMAVVAVIGAATAIFAATIGIAQNDIKKVLAYSTISQLGYMFLACGVGAFTAGIFHVMTHAFFKALLFLGSGSVIHGMSNEQDMRRMGGLRKYMPITFSTMAVGWLAISGVPLLSGFFSKDEILWRTWSTGDLPHNWGKALWVVAAITAVITAVYMTRLMVMTFWGSERFTENHDDHHAASGHASGGHAGSGHGGDHGHHGRPHESGWLMTAPLIILAMLSIAGGYVGVPEALGGSNKFERFLEPAIGIPKPAQANAVAAPMDVMAQSEPHSAAPAPEAHGADAQAESEGGHDVKTERLFTVISSVLALLGLGFGLSFFNRNPLWRAPKLLEDKYRVDEFYDATVIGPVENLSRDGLWKIVDVKIIDGIVNGVARMFAALASALRYTQTGFARNYAAVILLGAIIVIGYFIVSLGH
ncbi:MAG TPA: NADH-quinone oxidoreductase subunit L [Blastocatellia bacterium]|jgi:NADH-quinone oxidoreductase subunit L|nr:NADH-quinone oxidoreductase subunit L [Blastocatellia bacterium]